MQYPTEREQEALDLLQEECCEVGQAISKIRRFGLDFRAKGGSAPYTNKEELQREVWDILIYFDVLQTMGLIDLDPKGLEHYLATEKLEKLQKWTNLFKDTDSDTDSGRQQSAAS
jgi:NTP pyrophosphatase (non-canonical NTP hydrolase)